MLVQQVNVLNDLSLHVLTSSEFLVRNCVGDDIVEFSLSPSSICTIGLAVVAR